jgi:glycosyltransferase involved in cell wall biosynthesis
MSPLTHKGPPLVSIITPVFNAGPFLRRAVESALCQTCGDFELILVDDGSTDTAIEEVTRLGDPRLRLLRQTNQGAPSACNAAFGVARGEYVAFLDQDDLWAPEKLARHIQCFSAHPDVEITFTWTSYVGEDDECLGLPSKQSWGRIRFEDLFVDNAISSTSAVAIRRDAIEAVGHFDPKLPLMYDLDLYLRILRLHPAAAMVIPEALTYYRRHGVQQSQDWRNLRRDWNVLIDKWNCMAPEDVRRFEVNASVNMNRYFAYLAYERRSFACGCKLLAEGFRIHPAGFIADFRNWKLVMACLAGLVLPKQIHKSLEGFAGIRGFPGERVGNVKP